MKLLAPVVCCALAGFACSQPKPRPSQPDQKISFKEERYFGNIRQLTSGGTNAEAYWSFDGESLSLQHKGHGPKGPHCDQIYTMKSDGSQVRAISRGKGRTTCAFFLPGDSRVLFSSTFGTDEKCPTNPDMSKGYVWPIYDSYQIYSATTEGEDVRVLEPGAPKAYNAEATVCKDGSVIFTSDRDGDLELYRGQLDSMGTMTDVKRLTKALGYDGGAFFSQDCKRIVWRASRPRPGKETDDYKSLLERHLVRPGQLEIWVADADGSHSRQITRMGNASFAPYFTPDGNRVVFASNPRDPRGRRFDIYMIHVDGTRLERISFSDTFESFPMFSPDGKQIAFSSNRNATQPHETNVFVADWIDHSPRALSTDDADPANRFKALVEELSAPGMEGRGLGTAGLSKAEDLVAERFFKIGLRPFFETYPKAEKGTGYKQTVDIQIRTKLEPSRVTTAHNVLGTWGQGCGAMPPVIIGAHLDHLGSGAENSLEPSKTGLHPGADDNASGVAGVIEAARFVMANSASKKSCYVFAAFAGEEVGIAGSSRLAELFKNMKVRPKAMLNLDMIGRMEENRLIVFGTASAKEWKTIVEKECEAGQLSCPGGGDGYGPSDQMAFYKLGSPVLHFFTGPHADYHRASDTADKINATGGVQAAELIAAVALRTGSPKLRLHYQKASGPSLFGKTLFDRKRKSNGVYLGTIPDYSAMTLPGSPETPKPSRGVKLSGTRPGSPAEKAGVKSGDILLGIESDDTHLFQTLEDFMATLMALKPGQEIKLLISREGTELKLPATVGKRE